METCGETLQQTGEEEGEVEGIEEEEVVEVVEVREEIVGGRAATIALHTMTTNADHLAGVGELPWVVAELLAVAQVIHSSLFILRSYWTYPISSLEYNCFIRFYRREGRRHRSKHRALGQSTQDSRRWRWR